MPFAIYAAEEASEKIEKTQESDPYHALNFFGSVLERVRNEYVDDVSITDLIDKGVNGMLSGLDRHSYLIDEKDYKEMRSQMKGEFGGLGVEVIMESGLIKVISPMDDSPAQKAGIRPGDFITHIEDKIILGMKIDEAIEKLKGKPGTTVKITVRREGQKPIDMTIKREIIQTRPVRAKREGDFIYFRIATFIDSHTALKLKQEYEKIKKDGKPVKGIILDVRNNGGGLFDEALSVTECFLDKGKEIVSIRGRQGKDIQRFHANSGDMFKGLPIVCLINRGTASAPEIMAGALKDHKRAILIGEQSYGKGSVQTVIPLRDKKAIRLTTARYYTPSGVTIQDEGISPDIEVPLAIVEKIDLGPRLSEKDLPGGVKKKEQEKKEDEKSKKEDAQKDEKKKEEEQKILNNLFPEVKEKKQDESEKDDQTKSSKEEESKKGEKTKEDKAKKEMIDYQLERAIDLLKSMVIYKEMIK